MAGRTITATPRSGISTVEGFSPAFCPLIPIRTTAIPVRELGNGIKVLISRSPTRLLFHLRPPSAMAQHAASFHRIPATTLTVRLGTPELNANCRVKSFFRPPTSPIEAPICLRDFSHSIRSIQDFFLSSAQVVLLLDWRTVFSSTPGRLLSPKRYCNNSALAKTPTDYSVLIRTLRMISGPGQS